MIAAYPKDAVVYRIALVSRLRTTIIPNVPPNPTSPPAAGRAIAHSYSSATLLHISRLLDMIVCIVHT